MFDIDPTEREKLEMGLRLLQGMSLDQLTDKGSLLQVIRTVGLRGGMPTELYGPDMKYMNKAEGLWQIPSELADLMLLLSKFQIRQALEIGTHFGWTAALLACYLQRVSQLESFTTIDVTDEHWYIGNIADAFDLPLAQILANSNLFKGRIHNFVLIDGDHSAEWCRKDWKNVGQYATVCAFHDARHPNVRQVIDEVMAGVGTPTRLLIDYITPAHGDHPWMGISVIVSL